MTPSPEQEIDLIELAQKVWKERKFILKACGIGVLVGLVVAFSIPKEYKTTVKLSPENSESNKAGQLGGLAAMAGINLGGMSTGSDALTPELYPDIVQSTPFLLELVNIPVGTTKGDLNVSFYEYITVYQKTAWWNYIKTAPLEVLGWGMSLFRDKEPERNEPIDPFKLTAKQDGFIQSVKGKITIDVDKKTGVIAVSVMMQDPLISATITNIVLTKLQEYITDYRTRKAKHDLKFSEKLFTEAKESYYKSQKTYTIYVDANRNIVSASFKTEEERLRNEMNLTYGVYNQMAQQLEANKIKVQEVTPVYAVIEPARMAIRATKPNKLIMLIGFVFFTAFISTIWLLGKEFIIGLKQNI